MRNKILYTFIALVINIPFIMAQEKIKPNSQAT